MKLLDNLSINKIDALLLERRLTLANREPGFTVCAAAYARQQPSVSHETVRTRSYEAEREPDRTPF